MPKLGDKVGSCEIRKAIGNGGHGSVWLAYCNQQKFNVAVKVLHDKLIGQRIREKGPTIAERFLAEAKILQSLHHPGLCKIYDVFDFREQRQVAYSMELLNGADLTVASAYLSLSEMLNIFAKTADTLQYLHDNDVIHRDVKPANIFINDPRTEQDETRQIKLLDFGVAKELHQEAILSETATGIFVGSVQTMAPESFNRWDKKSNEQISPQIDQWAFGVSLYQCLSSKLPFHGQNMVDLIIALEQARPAPLELRADFQSSDVGGELEAIIFRTLNKLPQDRYSSMTELANELRNITQSLGDGVGTVVTSTDFLESTLLSKPTESSKKPVAQVQPPPLKDPITRPGRPIHNARPNEPVPSQSPPAIASHSHRASTVPQPEPESVLKSVVRMGALEFYLWLMTIFVLGFIAGFIIREL